MSPFPRDLCLLLSSYYSGYLILSLDYHSYVLSSLHVPRLYYLQSTTECRQSPRSEGRKNHLENHHLQ